MYICIPLSALLLASKGSSPPGSHLIAQYAILIDKGCGYNKNADSPSASLFTYTFYQEYIFLLKGNNYCHMIRACLSDLFLHGSKLCLLKHCVGVNFNEMAQGQAASIGPFERRFDQLLPQRTKIRKWHFDGES